jgi:small subunit ribosomal protein S3
MGQKVNPIGFRLSVCRNWSSRWYATKKHYPLFLKEDYDIRLFLKRRLSIASFSEIFIERAGERVRVKIFTPRPGAIIGRKGQDLDILCRELKEHIGREILVDVQEIRRPDLVAQLVAENISLQLERRIFFRRAMKKAAQSAMTLGADGIKIRCAGRLGGAEIARAEFLHEGRVPLHTLKENIDYGFSEAHTVYGKIGVKCWICRNDGVKI